MAHDAPIHLDFVHRLRFTREAFNPGNDTLATVLEPLPTGPAKAIVFVDEGVLKAHPGLDIEAYVQPHGDRVRLMAPVQVVPGGEQSKNEPGIVDTILKAIHDAGICRQSYVIVVGGGAVLDVVGYAASIAHRGVRLVRIPSTTLAQGDSGVGVKNGINAFGKKNYLGVFSVPWAVINDEALLETLDDVQWRGGFAEAIKVGLIKDPALYASIRQHVGAIRDRREDASMPVIRRSAELHLDHIARGGDPFEITTARPLDFGHWSAHKLEQLSEFHIGHGDAVAMGLAIDIAASHALGRLDEDTCDDILNTLSSLGFPIFHPLMEDPRLLDGLEEFREHLGGQLTLILLEGVGRPIEVHEMDASTVAAAVQRLSVHHAAHSSG